MSSLRTVLLALSLSLSAGAAAPAFADTAIQLVPKRSDVPGKSITVSTKGAAITTDEFIAVILDGDHYPMTATYMGVKALFDCRTLEKRSDGSTIIYQRSGSKWPIASREWVIQLKATTHTETKAVVEWNLVQHTQTGETFSGPFASALNAHPDAVYTPYNHGTWVYDRTAGTISYAVQSDTGGSLPDFMTTQSAVMAFPKELLKTRWGVVAE